MDQKYNDLKKTIKEPVEKWKKKQIFDFLNAMEFPAKDHSIYLQEFGIFIFARFFIKIITVFRKTQNS